MTIIAFAGLKASGKDTACDVLVKKHGFKKISLADPLRELCSEVFDIPMNLFLDRDKKDSELPRFIDLTLEHIDKIVDYVQTKWKFVLTSEAQNDIIDSVGTRLMTPRDVLKFVGTDILRYHLRDDIWIVLAFSKIAEFGGAKVCIGDIRFKNERDAFKEVGTLCLIKRPDMVDEEETHVSENTGEDDEYDVIFQNVSKKNVFDSEVNMWYTLVRESLYTRKRM